MNKVMVCVDMTDESVELYKDNLKSLDWSHVDEVHLVHAFQLVKYTDTFYMVSYPQETEHGEIEKSVDEILERLAEDVFPGADKPKIITKCIFSAAPKEGLVEYATDNKITEMIIGTRGKHGVASLFSSSFAEYMIRHAHCALRILRAKQ